MFTKVAVVFSTLAVFAAAAPTNNASQCNTGTAQCCNTVKQSSDQSVNALLGLLGIVVDNLTGQVGLACTPITVAGAGQGANCAQTPVCCQGNQFNGLITVGCTPISI